MRHLVAFHSLLYLFSIAGFIILFGYRIFSILNDPTALEVYTTGIASKGSRRLAIFLMSIGIVANASMLLLMTFKEKLISGHEGMAYVLLALLVLLNMLGLGSIIGIIIFEMTRFRGLNTKKAHKIGNI